MTKLTPVLIDNLIRGASLLSCGGGLKFSEQIKLAKGKRVQLVSPNELRLNDWCATVSEVGAADAPVMAKTKLPQAIKLLEAKTGKTITALIPPEVGQEAIVIDAAAITGLPIVDSDLAGCRAVPRLSNLALVILGLKFTMSPAVVLTAVGDSRFISQQSNLKTDETKIRRLVPRDQVVTLVGGLVQAKTICRYLNYSSYTTAISLGTALGRKQSLKLVLPTPVLFGPKTAIVLAVHSGTARGFDSKIVTMMSAAGRLKLTVENEYMKLETDRQTFAFPQLIMVFDSVNGRGVHSSELTQGKNFDLVVADAFAFWKEKL
ncbi:MAG: DUF917 family protein [Patescibacteria group bacterium]|nr:DUF917 domain-containing protein [Patescibacteria group bacterium]MDP4031212.1 DUF917 family protein [Candidatus Beckwithbacteria bacterium]MDZ4229167.1 DUF917 family protein [Patescibacteria group bacterium]